MTPGEILLRCQGLPVAKTRQVDDEYTEVVLYIKDVDQWQGALSGILGDAEKPMHVKPGRDHQALAKKFGGIRHDQTLFAKRFDGATVVAMFWPWRDRTHITLKMGTV